MLPLWLLVELYLAHQNGQRSHGRGDPDPTVEVISNSLLGNIWGCNLHLQLWLLELILHCTSFLMARQQRMHTGQGSPSYYICDCKLSQMESNGVKFGPLPFLCHAVHMPCLFFHARKHSALQIQYCSNYNTVYY